MTSKEKKSKEKSRKKKISEPKDSGSDDAQSDDSLTPPNKSKLKKYVGALLLIVLVTGGGLFAIDYWKRAPLRSATLWPMAARVMRPRCWDTGTVSKVKSLVVNNVAESWGIPQRTCRSPAFTPLNSESMR